MRVAEELGAFERQRPATVRILLLATFMNIFALAFWLMQHEDDTFTYGDALYFTVITGTTVGYGDVTPSTDAAKWATVVLLPPAVVFVSTSLSKVRVPVREAPAASTTLQQEARDFSPHEPACFTTVRLRSCCSTVA
jgi:voltage-gated potassium channel Kch